VAVVAGGQAVGLGGPAALVQLLVGAVAEVGVALGDQGVDGGVVAVQPFLLMRRMLREFV
jgi:hypothetical protein